MRLRRVVILGRERQLLLLGRAAREIDPVLRVHCGNLPTRRAKVPASHRRPNSFSISAWPSFTQVGRP